MIKYIMQMAARGRLTIFLFHKVPLRSHDLLPNEIDCSEFERFLRFIQVYFQILPLHDALVSLKADRLPPRSACITFDDGYSDWLSGPVAVLEKLNIHATFFVTTGQLKGQPLWNERILHSVSRRMDRSFPFDLSQQGADPLFMNSVTEKKKALTELDRIIKYQPPSLKELTLRRLEEYADLSLEDVPVISPNDIRIIHSKGFGIGAHAVSHPILSRCSPCQAKREIVDAKEELESLIRAPIHAFAYPNGIPGLDFGPEHIEMVKRAGYQYAMTTHRGAATSKTCMFQIPRFTPWGPSSGRMVAQLLRNLNEKPNMLAEGLDKRKRVLMVAFHFPPQAGSSGVLRTLNFAKNLPKLGWKPIVLTATPPAYTECRNDLIDEISPDVMVVRAYALDAARHLSIKGKYPNWIGQPDRWGTWWFDAVLNGMRTIKKDKPELIWATYPIATAHWIGASLAKRSGLPLIADFRDPMVTDDFPANRLQRLIWTAIERQTLKLASSCIFTTQRAAESYQKKYPAYSTKCIVIENGFDDDAFVHNKPERGGLPLETTLMLHSGIIYPGDRDPGAFFQAVSRMIAEKVLPREKIRIRFRAPHHAKEVLAIASLHNLIDIVEIAPPIAYKEAISEILAADLLLLFQGKKFNAQVPAKMYEYLRSERPILGLVDQSGDAANQLRKFASPMICQIDDPAQIEKSLSAWWSTRSSEYVKSMLRADSLIVHKYSRSHQTERLSHIMNQTVEHFPNI